MTPTNKYAYNIGKKHYHVIRVEFTNAGPWLLFLSLTLSTV